VRSANAPVRWWLADGVSSSTPTAEAGHDALPRPSDGARDDARPLTVAATQRPATTRTTTIVRGSRSSAAGRPSLAVGAYVRAGPPRTSADGRRPRSVAASPVHRPSPGTAGGRVTSPLAGAAGLVGVDRFVVRGAAPGRSERSPTGAWRRHRTVDRIVGPEHWVTAASSRSSGVGIDLPADPRSHVLADGSADPEHFAADLSARPSTTRLARDPVTIGRRVRRLSKPRSERQLATGRAPGDPRRSLPRPDRRLAPDARARSRS